MVKLHTCDSLWIIQWRFPRREQCPLLYANCAILCKIDFLFKKCSLLFVFVHLSSEIFVNYFNVFKKNCISRNGLHAYVISCARYKNHQICFHVMHQLFLISLFISKEKSFYTRIINNIIKWKRILLILLKSTNIHPALHVTITMSSFH